jgi:hypothetical protein
MNSPDAYLIANLTIAEYRKFRNALKVLKSAGVEHDRAVDILLQAVHVQRTNTDRRRFAS